MGRAQGDDCLAFLSVEGAAKHLCMLHTVDLATAEAHGARCLDGSPPWFYYDRPRSPGGSGSNNVSWLVMLDGGAWCYSLDECAVRAKNGRGSSLQARQRSWVYSGLMDPSPAHNPAFASFHRVLLGYCDGGSFAGNREAALHDSSGRPVWFRGRRNLDAQIEALRGLSLAPTPSAVPLQTFSEPSCRRCAASASRMGRSCSWPAHRRAASARSSRRSGFARGCLTSPASSCSCCRPSSSTGSPSRCRAPPLAAAPSTRPPPPRRARRGLTR